MVNHQIDRPTMTPTEFSQEYGMGINTVMKLLAAGELPAVRWGRRWFISRAAVEKMLASSHHGALAEDAATEARE